MYRTNSSSLSNAPHHLTLFLNWAVVATELHDVFSLTSMAGMENFRAAIPLPLAQQRLNSGAQLQRIGGRRVAADNRAMAVDKEFGVKFHAIRSMPRKPRFSRLSHR